MDRVSYKESGVDIDAGNALIERIKPAIKSTFSKNVIGGIGSFSGAYALPSGYKEPVILGATDGVGTKLKLAIDSKKFDTVGVDLVAMCVNDLICNFAEPLFFLDYYASGKLDVDEATSVIEGIARGCIEAECSLIGGESAEMPGMYRDGDFDLAGFAVGIAERSVVERDSSVCKGDLILALPSSGFHSNGYSLVRKLFFETLNMSFEDEIEGVRLIDILLEPTRIYVKEFKKYRDSIKALAHITGGGILENIPRALPCGLSAKIDKKSIKTAPIFSYITKYVDEFELYRTFNMGVGMVVICSKESLDSFEGSDAYLIGEVIDGDKKVVLA